MMMTQNELTDTTGPGQNLSDRLLIFKMNPEVDVSVNRSDGSDVCGSSGPARQHRSRLDPRRESQ